MDDIEQAEQLFRDRRERFNRILDGYELGAGDWTLVGTPKRTREEAMRMHPQPRVDVDAKHVKPGRWVLITHSDHVGYFAENVGMVEDLGHVAVANLHEAQQPVCYFDLDELAGDEPSPREGDRVALLMNMHGYAARAHGGDWYVVESTTAVADGIAYEELDLARGPDGEPQWTGIDEQYVTVLERAEPDERMPVRYGLAKIVTAAVFNTIPSP